MNLRTEYSPIDGLLHSENLLILQSALLATTRDQLGQRAPGIFAPTDLYNMVASSSLLPKMTVVRDYYERKLLIVLNGMSGFDKVQACLTGWANAGVTGDGFLYPYQSAAQALYSSIFSPGAGQVWDSVRIIGHSYGGAVAMHLAGQVPNVGRQTDMKMYTYGAPKPGLRASWRTDLIENTRRVFLTGDPVPKLPISHEEMASLWTLVGVPLARKWSEWDQPCSGLAPLPTNTLVVQNNPLYVPTFTFYITLAGWATGISAFGSDQHTLDAYERALAVIPAVSAPNPFPSTYRTHRSHTMPTANQLDTERQVAIIQAAEVPAQDPAQAVIGIRAGIQIQQGEIFHGAVRSGVNAIIYNGDIVQFVRTRRLRRAMVRALNRSLRKP